MKKNVLFWNIIVSLLSVVLILSYSKFSYDAFLFDDNLNQWYPVIERAYGQLFSDGSMPFYDFHLSKGLAFANPGYYSIFNPIMFISYCMSHYVGIPFNTIAVYICICFGLGNVFFFRLGWLVSKDIKFSFMIVLAYASCSVWVTFGYWYYIFNNFLILPILFLTLLSFRKSKWRYILAGSVLGIDAYLGNFQYTCYHYITYVFFNMLLVFMGEKKRFIETLSNVCLGIILSIPILLLGLRASSDFGLNDEFLRFPLDSLCFLVSSSFPLQFVDWINFFPSLYKDPFCQRVLCYSGSLTILLIISGIYGCYKKYHVLKCKLENEKLGWTKLIANVFFSIQIASHKRKILVATVLIIFFWLSFLEGGLVAWVMHFFPVISKFRYLFKSIFILTPLLALGSVFFYTRMLGLMKKIFLLILFCGSVIGFIQNIFVYKDIRGLFLEPNLEYSENLGSVKVKENLLENKIDLKNYRLATFFNKSFFSNNDCINETCYDRMTLGLTRNYPIFIESFSLSAYEISTSKQRLRQFDKIYENGEFLTIYANAGYIKHLLFSATYEKTELVSQLKSNSVKYLLLRKWEQNDSLQVKNVVSRLDTIGEIGVEKYYEFNELFWIVELSGIPMIVRGQQDVLLNDERMDLISFTPSGIGDHTISFGYDEKLVAYSVLSDGAIKFHQVKSDNQGNISLFVSGNEKIFLSYEDKICIFALVMEFVSCVFFIIACIKLLCKRREIESFV